MRAFEFLRSGALSLPPLAKFALGMVMIFGIPRLSRQVRLPAVVGLLLSRVVVGPHVLGKFGEQRPIADFFADLGKLLLIFAAGLEIDLAHFRQAATLAATLVVFKTFDPAGQRLIDRRMLDVVLVLMLSTATFGPVLTQHFAPRMREDPAAREALDGRVPSRSKGRAGGGRMQGSELFPTTPEGPL